MSQTVIINMLQFKLKLLLPIFFVITLLSFTRSAAQSWSPLGPDDKGLLVNKSDLRDIVSTSDGTLYTTYTDISVVGTGKVTVKKLTPEGWVTVGNEYLNSGIATQCKLVVDKGDNLYVSLCENYVVYLYKFDGTSWVSMAPGLSAIASYAYNLVLDANDVPYIGYWAYPYKLYVNRLINGAWESVGTNPLDQAVKNFSGLNLRFDSKNVLYIGYQTSQSISVANDTFKIKRFVDNGWEQVARLPYTVLGTLQYPCFILDQKDSMYIGYTDINSSKLMVKKFSANTWKTIGSAISAGYAYQVSLTFNSKNVLHSTHFDGSTYKIVTQSYDGTSWTPLGTNNYGNTGTYSASSPKLIFAKNDNPYIVCVDGLNNTKSTVLNYSGGQWTPVPNRSGISDAMVNNMSLRLDRKDVPYIAYLDVYNGDKATVKTFVSGNWQTVGKVAFTAAKGAQLVSDTDTNNVIYVANVEGSTNTIIVMRYINNAWTKVGATITAGGTVSSLSLKINPKTNEPYVFYVDGKTGASNLKFFNSTTSAWSDVLAAGFLTTFTATAPIMSIDKGGIVHIAFQNTNTYKTLAVGYISDGVYNTISSYVSYREAKSINIIGGNKAMTAYLCFDDAYYTGTNKALNIYSCENGSLKPLGSIPGNYANPSLAVAATGGLFVAFSDNNNNSRVTVMQYTGNSNWEAVNNTGFSAGFADNIGLAVSSTNELFVGYKNNWAFVKKTDAPVVTTLEDNELAADPKKSNMFYVADKTILIFVDGAYDFQVIDATGTLIKQIQLKGPASVEANWPAGVYIGKIVSSDNSTYSKKFILH